MIVCALLILSVSIRSNGLVTSSLVPMKKFWDEMDEKVFLVRNLCQTKVESHRGEPLQWLSCASERQKFFDLSSLL